MRNEFAISLTSCLTVFLATLWSFSLLPHDVGSHTPPSDVASWRRLEAGSPIRLEAAHVRAPVLSRSVDISLDGGALAEIEMEMTEGEQASFSWKAREKGLSFRLRGRQGNREQLYEAGRDIRTDNGTVVSPMTGHIGWDFRNETSVPTVLSFETRGNFRTLRWHAHSQ